MDRSGYALGRTRGSKSRGVLSPGDVGFDEATEIAVAIASSLGPGNTASNRSSLNLPSSAAGEREGVRLVGAVGDG